jgi:uncharacterized membrane protein
MLRLAEIGLFLVPFALYAVWRLLGWRASAGLVWATTAILAGLAMTIVWYGLQRSLPAGSRYVPAQLQDTTAAPRHGG